ncbi:TWiK family of potassium channel [Trichostrongylus colubriformis]|uniref:TWiK family of potassium channel n=1 Tax=Trichostrongylus colubriformis TaxID=6319 RepID=A0AAN8FW75_TRICO
MIERQMSKSQAPTTTMMPTPTSTERKFTDSFYWLSHLHKKLGLSHIILLLVLAAYSALGAVVFYYLETPNERMVVAERKLILDDRIEQLAEYLSDMAENKTVEELALDVKNAYIDMLNTEGTYKWSTFYRSADPENNYKWTYGSSFFFAMNVYTTTGYGSIAPETRAGQWFVIIYGFIFVPVTLVVVRDLGQWLLLAITRVYARMLLKYRRWRGRKSENTNEVIRLPIFISCLIMIGFIGFCTVFVYYLDAYSGPPGTGIDWFHSMYFSYMSFTTIGLGDVMPNNATFAPIISILFFLGLPVMKVVNRMTYLTVENGAFGLLTVIENRIDNYWERKQAPTTGEGAGSGEEGQVTKAKDESDEIPAEWVNNITIHSIATFMKANRDVYGGSFGKVNLRAADVMPSNEQDTVRSRRSNR